MLNPVPKYKVAFSLGRFLKRPAGDDDEGKGGKMVGYFWRKNEKKKTKNISFSFFIFRFFQCRAFTFLYRVPVDCLHEPRISTRPSDGFLFLEDSSATTS